MKQRLIEVVQSLRSKAHELPKVFYLWLQADKRRALIVGSAFAVLCVYACSRGEEKVHYIYEGKEKQFAQERVIENPYKHIAENKIEMVEESEDRLRSDNRTLQKQMGEIKQALEDLKSGLIRAPQAVKSEAAIDAAKAHTPAPAGSPATEEPKILDGQDVPSPPSEFDRKRRGTISQKGRMGPFSVSFPVAVKREEKNTGVVIPSGSYVKAKVVSGVQVPMGETYPTLLQLD